MGYEIYYDKRFLLIDDDKYIPIIQHGSNNCWEPTYTGRDIPEKNWNVANYPFNDRYIFSKEEIIEMGEKSVGCDMAKSRGRFMTEDEIRKFYINGYKGAKSLEYYLELGNTFQVVEGTNRDDMIWHKPKTTDELVELIERLVGEGKRISMGFTQRKLYLPKRTTVQKVTVENEQNHYFVLCKRYEYFHKILKYGYRYSGYSSSCKKFLTEKDATIYLDKYKDRLKDFSVRRIDEVYKYYA